MKLVTERDHERLGQYLYEELLNKMEIFNCKSLRLCGEKLGITLILQSSNTYCPILKHLVSNPHTSM